MGKRRSKNRITKSYTTVILFYFLLYLFFIHHRNLIWASNFVKTCESRGVRKWIECEKSQVHKELRIRKKSSTKEVEDMKS